MTSDNEKFCDDVIAPRLQDVANLCRERGMSLLATIEHDYGAMNSSILLHRTHSFAMTMIAAAQQASGNVDALIFALMKHGKEYGHNSLCLQQLGISCTPDHEAVQ